MVHAYSVPGLKQYGVHGPSFMVHFVLKCPPSSPASSLANGITSTPVYLSQPRTNYTTRNHEVQLRLPQPDNSETEAERILLLLILRTT